VEDVSSVEPIVAIFANFLVRAHVMRSTGMLRLKVCALHPTQRRCSNNFLGTSLDRSVRALRPVQQ
jgi:hypothetical protein